MKTPQSKSTKLDEIVLFIKEKCIDTSDPGLVWFDFRKAKTQINAYVESKVLEGRIKTLKSVSTGRIDIPLGLEVLRQRLAELTPKGRSEK